MAQQFDSPKTETQLREIQDRLYQRSTYRYQPARPGAAGDGGDWHLEFPRHL